MRRLFSSILQRSSLKVSKGVELSTYVAYPKNVARPLTYVAIMHGISDHMGYYDELADSLTQRGFCVFGYDRRGKGNTKGDPAYMVNRAIDLQDFTAVRNSICNNERVHLIGNSLGGLLALQMGLKTPEIFKSVITINPAISQSEKAVQCGAFKLFAFKLMLSTPFVNLLTFGAGDLSAKSKDKEFVKRMIDDKLFYKGPLKGNAVREIYRMMNEVVSQAPSMRVPWLLHLSKNDEVVNSHISKKVFSEVKLKDKILYEYDAGHDLPNNTIKENTQLITEKTISWLNSHL